MTEELETALRFCADKSNYGGNWKKVCEDGGMRAREALKQPIEQEDEK